MAQQIFRKASLDRLSSPDQLDQLLTVTAPRHWFALIGITALIGVGVVWGFTGSIPTKVIGQGVLVRSKGIFSVASTGAGRIVELLVSPGDTVQAGSVVATVAQPQVRQKIRAAQQELADLELQRDKVLAARAQAIEMRDSIYESQRKNLEQDIANAEHEAKLAADQVPVDESLFERGIIAQQTVLADKQKVAALQSHIADLRTRVATIVAERQQLHVPLDEMKAEFASRINGLKHSQGMLELDYSETAKVVSPHAGRVLEVKVAQGGLVGTGAPVATIELAVPNFEVLTYVPAGQAKSIKAGMKAEVSPTTVKREEYGYLLGHVTSVADFPATPSAVMRTLENEALVQTLAGSAVTQVRLELETDPRHGGSFRWSSSRGPSTPITSGTLTSVQIVTRERRPASLVVPLLKEKLGAP